MGRVHVEGLDHVALSVADPARSLAWYCEELGLEPIRAEEWHRGEAPFPSVRIDDRTIIDLLPQERMGENLDHLCLVVSTADVDRVMTSGRFVIVDGPGPRFGARGEGISVYVSDPDGNVVELRHYG